MLLLDFRYTVANAALTVKRFVVSQLGFDIPASSTVVVRANVNSTPPAVAGLTITKALVARHYIPAGGVQVTGEVVAVGDGTKVKFTGTLAKHPVDAGSLSVTSTTGGATAVRGTDLDGDQVLQGAGLASGSTINYRTGAFTLIFGAAPTISTNVLVSYNTSPGSASI